MKLYTFVRVAFGPIFKFLFRLKVHGSENIPEKGGLLICPNHISALDVILLTAVTKQRKIHYMAKAELFKIPLLGQLIKALGAFPVNRGAGDAVAIKKTIKYLNDGETVGMFPQGTRYTGVDPRESSVKHGAGMVLYRAPVPVMPVAIITKGHRISLFKRVDIVYGKPILPEELGFEKGGREEHAFATEKIFSEILKLHEAGVPKK